MFYLFFLLFIALCLGLVFSIFKEGRFRIAATIFRITVVIISISVFSYYFVTKSINQFRKDSLTVQLINTLPFPLDFYIVKVNNDKNSAEKYVTTRSGSIRTDYYRIEYLDMKNSDQFWVAGFMGRKNMVYFSQHAVPNKNEDQIIEIRNYINQSQKLSEIAQTQIEVLKSENMKTAIWFTLDLLLLFLNIILLLRRSK
ncbi:hypothetical protein H0S70_13985 [Chryseobacterium manosquense]|uniref:Uncharacterized protein n=1 Tax=Chryseobacterium manosquense TaxID=2754694 RepID=A0A7H1DWP8_9FLAO|nr:hypothetical protein [Chryseobacterium manosquense]QNS41406.1 hypothetical protein H0S70_13985 [Chryseobacterium manosquense]